MYSTTNYFYRRVLKCAGRQGSSHFLQKQLHGTLRLSFCRIDSSSEDLCKGFTLHQWTMLFDAQIHSIQRPTSIPRWRSRIFREEYIELYRSFLNLTLWRNYAWWRVDHWASSIKAFSTLTIRKVCQVYDKDKRAAITNANFSHPGYAFLHHEIFESIRAEQMGK